MAKSTNKKLTPAQEKALGIVLKHGPIRPRGFARKMWPDSDGWRRSSKCGPKGSARGGGMNLAGGGYLGKLARKDWVKMLYEPYPPHRARGYVITSLGKAMLTGRR